MMMERRSSGQSSVSYYSTSNSNSGGVRRSSSMTSGQPCEPLLEEQNESQSIQRVHHEQQQQQRRLLETGTSSDDDSSSHRGGGRREDYHWWMRQCLSPFTGEETKTAIVIGWIGMAIVGCWLGFLLPKDESLRSPWYRVMSNCLGYTYFLNWSVSFYPQVLSNWRRKSTAGLSPDFSVLNMCGFACYASYTLALYGSSTIQHLYKERYGPDAEISVQSNDVAFAVHAFLLSSITFGQIAYYDGIFQQASAPSYPIVVIIGVILTLALAIGPTMVAFSQSEVITQLRFNWLDYLYMLSYVKVFVTLVKYVPQVVLNYRRKSTMGWSIWQILLDFSGGLLSDLQLILDCADLGDYTGITGNLAKLVLGLVSISFDTIFMMQHYVWYADPIPDEVGGDSSRVDETGSLL